MKNITNISKTFLSTLETYRSAYDELLLSIYHKRNEESLKGMLSKQITFSILSLWEAFLSDILIAHIVDCSGVACSSFKERMQKSITDKFGKDALRYISIDFPKKLTWQKAYSLIDPKGWNISTNSAEKLTEKANMLLPAKHAKKFSLDAGDSEFFDYVRCLRHYLAHGSSSSKTELFNSAINLDEKVNASFKSPIGNISSYLKYCDASGKTRASHIVDRIEVIAKKIL